MYIPSGSKWVKVDEENIIYFQNKEERLVYGLLIKERHNFSYMKIT